MSGLPDWIAGEGGYAPLPGFDVDGWWVPITCTNGGRHPVNALGVIYERTDYSAKHRRDLIEAGELTEADELPRDWRFNHVEWAMPQIAFTTLSDEIREDVREAGTTAETDPYLYRGHGSLNVPCPAGCHRRIPRRDWYAIIRNTWDSTPDPRVLPFGVDLSMYG